MSTQLAEVRREWLGSPAFGSVNGGCTVAALLLTALAGGILAGGGSWLLFGIMLTIALLLVAIVATRCVRSVRKSSPSAILSVLMDPKFFMPYCICPECKVEGLHWMKSAALARDRESLLKYYSQVEQSNSWPFSMFWFQQDDDARLLLAEQWATEREAKSDVIRECRDCGNTWGQKVGFDALGKGVDA